nr:immunoglobulin heavy chain junction region [Mus musculus]
CARGGRYEGDYW